MIRNKMLIAALLLANCLAFSSPAQAASPLIVVNGLPLVSETAPVIENGRILVPLRAIFEALSASVYWDATNRSITATTSCGTLKLTIDSSTAYKNDSPIILDVPAKIVDGYTMVPLRFVSEALGAAVEWDTVSQTAIITANTDPGST